MWSFCLPPMHTYCRHSQMFHRCKKPVSMTSAVHDFNRTSLDHCERGKFTRFNIFLSENSETKKANKWIKMKNNFLEESNPNFSIQFLWRQLSTISIELVWIIHAFSQIIIRTMSIGINYNYALKLTVQISWLKHSASFLSFSFLFILFSLQYV